MIKEQLIYRGDYGTCKLKVDSHGARTEQELKWRLKDLWNQNIEADIGLVTQSLMDELEREAEYKKMRIEAMEMLKVKEFGCGSTNHDYQILRQAYFKSTGKEIATDTVYPEPIFSTLYCKRCGNTIEVQSSCG